MSWTWIWIVATMLSAGLLGGYAGHLAITPQPNNTGDPPPTPPTLKADLVIGVVAALCVPIFLQITQSRLMETLWGAAELPNIDLLYLAGFCLIAAFSSRAFLQNISGQVIRRIQEKQDDLEKKQRQTAQKQEELSDNVADSAETKSGTEQRHEFVAAPHAEEDLTPLLDALDDAQKRVVLALANENYTRRSLSGIMKEAALTRSATGQALERLMDRTLVTRGTSKVTGSQLYQLEPKGYRLADLLKRGGAG